MPLYEHQDVKVTLIVEVDGHVLTFERTGKARGARWHGADPRKLGFSTHETLESSIREVVDELADREVGRAQTFLQRAYPIHSDNREDEK